MKKTGLLLGIAVLILLSGCGGGGGGAPTPPPPTNFNATRDWPKDAQGNYTQQKVTLTWGAVSGASEYKIYRQKEDEQSPTLLSSTDKLIYTDTLSGDDLIKDITYYVSAVVNSVEGDKASAEASAPPPPCPFSSGSKRNLLDLKHIICFLRPLGGIVRGV